MKASTREQMAVELQLAMQRNTMWTVLLHHTVAGKAGINVTDLQCLNLLSLDGPMTPGQLAQSMGLTTGGAITAVVDRLEKAGYVLRSRDPDDRRKVIIEPVRDKVALLSTYFEPIGRSVMARFAAYTDEQLEFLLDFARTNNEAMPGVIKEVQAMS
ncbi:MarR family winged helix-turn-helix transcriptional regulator [Actinomadura scrupuli]|uniref:MarR family winged helix-turn-helix transcriptional regulator n=1 Tax=Actinomadura scrupuli TaxID=559629 RepID=UPI003D95A7FB